MATHLISWDTYWINSASSSPGGGKVYDTAGEIRVYLESQSVANNYSYLRIDHYAKRWISMGAPSNLIASFTSKYRFDSNSYGTKSSSTSGFMQGDAQYQFLGSTYHTVYHNADGKKTTLVNGSFASTMTLKYGTDTIDTKSGSRTSSISITLPAIEQATTIKTFTRTNITLNSFRVNWATEHTVNRVQYRLNSGSWINGYSNTTGAKSGNFTISGLEPNTTYTIQIKVRRKDNSIETTSNTANLRTLDIAKFASVSDNINFEEPFIVTINRNGASNVKVGIYDITGTTAFVEDRIIEDTSYEFILTTEEKNALFNDMSSTSAKQYRIYLKTDDDTYRTYSTKTFIIINANPIFNNYIYEDTNSLTLALTEDNQTIIKGYSNLKVTIPEINKAIGQKGATIVKYQLVVGAKQATVDYQDIGDTIITLDNIDNNVFIVYAIDSRNNSTTVQKSPANFIDYSNPIVTNVLVERTGNIQPETTLSFSGTFSNIDFGTEVNQITATYKYSKTDVIDFIDGTTELILTKDGNTFTCEQLIAGDLGAVGFDTKFSYYIEVEVRDLVWNGSDSAILSSGIPNIAIHKKGVGINGEYNPTLPDGLQVSGEFTQNEETLILNEPFAKQALVFTALSFGVYTATIKHEIEEGLIIDCYFPPADVNTDIVELSLIEEEPAIPLVDALDTNIIASEIENTYQKIVYKNGKFVLLNQDNYYRVGETFELPEVDTAFNGYVTSGTTNLIISVSTPKSMKNIKTITCDILQAEMRCANGYVNSTSGYQNLKAAGYTITCVKIHDYLLRILIVKSTAYTNITNNTLVSLNFKNNFKLTFS